MKEIQAGDVVKYGPHPWQWGRVIEVDDKWVRVRLRYRVWALRTEVRHVISAKDWAGLKQAMNAQKEYDERKVN